MSRIAFLVGDRHRDCEAGGGIADFLRACIWPRLYSSHSLSFWFKSCLKRVWISGVNCISERVGILLDMMRIEGWNKFFGMGLAIACGFYKPFMSRLITIVENACNSQRVPKIATVLNSMRYIWARRFWVYELHLFVSVRHAPWLGYHQNLPACSMYSSKVGDN